MASPLSGGIVQTEAIVQPKPDPNVESVEPTDLPRTWQRLLDILSKKGPGIPSILSHGELKSIDGGKATIQFSSPTFAAMLDRNGKKEVIRDELSKLLEQPVGVAIEVNEAREAELRRWRKLHCAFASAGPRKSARNAKRSRLPGNPNHAGAERIAS